MKKNILLINPLSNDPADQYEIYPSGALLLIGTILFNQGHKVKIVHMLADQINAVGLRNIVTEFHPQVVGITMSTFQTKSAGEISSVIKEFDPKILTVTGGPHPSALRATLLKDFPDMDIAVVGEGEKTIVEIVDDKDWPEIKGIAYRKNGAVKTNELRPLVDLDDLPLLNLDLITLSRFKGSSPACAYPSMFIMASRGCPFHCVYCNKSVFGTAVRFRKPASIIEEIKWLHQQYRVKEIFFQDDTFNLDRKWCEEILNLIIDNGLNKEIVYKVAFRANQGLVDEKLLDLVKRAGVKVIFYGVESGNQRMLNSMKKGLRIEEIKRAFALTHQAGLKTIGAFMIGLPGENRQTVEDTFNLWKELRPYQSGLSPAIPLPGTEFEATVKRKGHLLVTNYDDYWPEKFLARTDELSKSELERLYRKTLFRMGRMEISRHPVKILISLRKRVIGYFKREKALFAKASGLFRSLFKSSNKSGPKPEAILKY